MSPSLRSGLAAALFSAAMMVMFLTFRLSANAQKPSGPPVQSQTPSPRKIPVITNENLPYPMVGKADHAADAPAAQPVSVAQQTSPVSAEAARKASEITSLQKQIRDKQKHIELLMRLFVTDEKRFVQFPGDAPLDRDARATIRYEQEELRRETAACAQLQARLDALQGSNFSSAAH